MFYKPQHEGTGRMWDTWLYLHDGVFYLYYLAASREAVDDQPWDNISMATSGDGVNWSEIGPVLHKREGATWMGTGSTWKSPAFEQDGKFFMNFSEWRGPRQTIFFAESTDLVRWRRLGDELEFVQDERWYERQGRWDCIWTIDRPGGGLYGYWTATPKAQTGGRFGFGESLDGVSWAALAPPVVHGIGGGEVGAIEKIGQKYYMMFGAGGMHTLVADRPEGPFHLGEVNAVLLSGHTYFSRFLRVGEDLLVNHHSILRDGTVHMGLLKRAVVDERGTARLAWWPGNEKLKGETVGIAGGQGGAGGPIAMLEGRFDAEGGVVMEGELVLPGEGQARRGLYVECEPGSGAAVLIGSDGSAELGDIGGDGKGYKVAVTEDRKMAFGQRAKFRLVLQRALLEFYLGDILMECFSLPRSATGRIGLICGGEAGSISGVRAWCCGG